MTIELPQRIVPVDRPGSLLKRAHAVRPMIEHPNDVPIGEYLAMIRACPCLCCGMDPCGEAAHVRMASGAHGKASGFGKKPSPQWTLPLDGGCHREDNDALHRVGEAIFFQRIGVNPFLVAERLWAKRGDLVAMRAVIFVAIAEREAISQAAGVARMARRPE